jgi:hypothetical protein
LATRAAEAGRNARSQSAVSEPPPADVAAFEEIEAVVMAVIALRDAMSDASPEYRWLATSMVTPEITEILTMLHEDDRSFAVHNIRDMGGEVRITPVEAP